MGHFLQEGLLAARWAFDLETFDPVGGEGAKLRLPDLRFLKDCVQAVEVQEPAVQIPAVQVVEIQEPVVQESAVQAIEVQIPAVQAIEVLKLEVLKLENLKLENQIPHSLEDLILEAGEAHA